MAKKKKNLFEKLGTNIVNGFDFVRQKVGLEPSKNFIEEARKLAQEIDAENPDSMSTGHIVAEWLKTYQDCPDDAVFKKQYKTLVKKGLQKLKDAQAQERKFVIFERKNTSDPKQVAVAQDGEKRARKKLSKKLNIPESNE